MLVDFSDCSTKESKPQCESDIGSLRSKLSKMSMFVSKSSINALCQWSYTQSTIPVL